VYIDHLISPFEGSLRAGAAEYVHRGDVKFILTNPFQGEIKLFGQPLRIEIV
jgi:hypothetical protein